MNNQSNNLLKKAYNSLLNNNNLGRYGAGNIDLYNRPQVKNDDGSISTVRSMSFNDGNNEVLIPTVSNNGQILSDNDAIDNYYKTGQYLGKGLRHPLSNCRDLVNKYRVNGINEKY